MYRLLLEVYANIYTGLVFGVCVLVLQGPFDEQNLIFLSLLTVVDCGRIQTPPATGLEACSSMHFSVWLAHSPNG